MRYRLIAGSNGILQIADDGTISDVPSDPGNVDWQIYQEWLSAGNSPEAPEAPDSATASPSGGEPTTASDAPTDGNPSP